MLEHTMASVHHHRLERHRREELTVSTHHRDPGLRIDTIRDTPRAMPMAFPHAPSRRDTTRTGITRQLPM